MKIGILEIMPQGHYTLVDSIARIYASDDKNECFIFTHKNGAKNLIPLLNENIGNIKLIIKEDNESLSDYFSKINNVNSDFIFLVTLEKYFKDILNFNFTCPLHLFIHNIDAWFQINLRYNLYNFFKEVSFSFKDIYHFKVNFVYPKLRKRIIQKLRNNDGRFVVLNSILKKELENYTDEKEIDIIPFSVYNKNIQDGSGENKCLRICIPGMVSQIRRDYLSVLELLENDVDLFKAKIEIDLLGGIVEYEEGRKIIEQALILNSKGVKIYYYDQPLVMISEFDRQLAKADFILGNMNVVLNKYSKYGKTKETGIPFSMIRAAKPGILPSGYALIDELKSSTLIYNNYAELKDILLSLVGNQEKIVRLKKEAQRNSLLFDPKYIYKNIKSNKN